MNVLQKALPTNLVQDMVVKGVVGMLSDQEDIFFNLLKYL